ncbi:unnamed protein product [Cochlearia groenlandica]
MNLVLSSELLIDDLLENYWFFENLFTRRSRVLRYCHSDPYPNSSSLTSPSKMGDSRKILEASLIQEPSSCIDRQEEGSQRKINNQLFEKIRVQDQRQDDSFLMDKEHMVLPKPRSCSAPGKIQESSLPPRIVKIEVDFEAKKMITKLTRQFSEKIRVLEPTSRVCERFLHKKETGIASKKEISESSIKNKTRTSRINSDKISLQRTQTMPNKIRREEEYEFEDQESDSRMGFLIREALASSHSNVQKVSSNERQRRNLRSEEITVMVKQRNSSPKTLRKTLSSIETTKEIQTLNSYIEPRVITRVATLPRVPYKDSNKEMKDQIKFWARAVATNVRQEC